MWWVVINLQLWHFCAHNRIKFYYVDVNKVPQALVKRGNISVCLNFTPFHNFNFTWLISCLIFINNFFIFLFSQKMPTIQVRFFDCAARLFWLYWLTVRNFSKWTVNVTQIWKDGEFKAEVIGGHQAWLVLDEVREMIQKFVWCLMFWSPYFL